MFWQEQFGFVFFFGIVFYFLWRAVIFHLTAAVTTATQMSVLFIYLSKQISCPLLSSQDYLACASVSVRACVCVCVSVYLRPKGSKLRLRCVFIKIDIKYSV